MPFNAKDSSLVHELALSPTLFGEEGVEGLKHQMAVVADDLVPDAIGACGEVPNEEELFLFCSDFGDGPEEVALRVQESYGPEDTVGRLIALWLESLFEQPAEEVEIGQVALSDELDVALMMRELKRRAHD